VMFTVYRTYYDEAGGVSQQGWDTYSSLNRLNSFTGVDNPRHRAQIAHGLNATTPASGVQYEVKHAWFSASIRSRGQFALNKELFESYEGYPPLPSLFASDTGPPASLASAVRNRCIAKFIEKADAVRSSFESGQDIGEIGETIRSVIHPFKSARELVFNYLAKVKKLSLKRAITKTSLRHAIGDSFLEFKFGWNPLAADIASGISDLTNNQGHPDTRIISASARDFYPISSAIVSSYGHGNIVVPIRGKCTGQYQVRYKGAIRTGAVKGRIPLLQNLQLDMPHFLPTLWDLIPYSWMIDYFANIGDIIKAASFQNANVSWGNVTTRYICNYEYSYGTFKPILNPTVTSYTALQPSGSPSGTSTSFNRSVFVGSDLMPDFRFQLPLGSAKPWENMTALLSGRILDIRKSILNIRR
jgi:hypothetical protein